ncbi:MAG: sulfide/dihydroorotate dehydrogenase-like FAD/NAD-binding protein [Myxococcota bacterium]
MYEILRKRDLTGITKLFEVKAPHVARNAQPGHFVIVRIHEQGERIPLTIADYDAQKGSVTIVVQEVGYTSAMLNRLGEGDQIVDFAGPLGVPAPMPTQGSVVLLGGGFGVAPILPIAKELRRREVKVTSIIGARSKDLIILEDEMRQASDEIHLCTDDGSAGFKGFVTQKLEELVAGGASFDECIAIGPMPMMRATAHTTKPMGLKTWVSMDPIMVDGTGMCGACRVTVSGKVKFACVDGPFFDAHEVDFDEALRRNRIYKQQEAQIYEVCRRGGESR